MFSSNGESTFLTQSGFKDDNEIIQTRMTWSDNLDMEGVHGAIKTDFDLIPNCVFSNISDDDIINACQEV